MSETPPMPPKHDGLVWIDGEIRLYVPQPESTMYAKPNAYWRPIIAAVARCAWLDEGARIQRDVLVDGKPTVGWYDKTQEAFANAEKWRDWGEEKP